LEEWFSVYRYNIRYTFIAHTMPLKYKALETDEPTKKYFTQYD